jgi:OmpA-OmpF porin, OOP family
MEIFLPEVVMSKFARIALAVVVSTTIASVAFGQSHVDPQAPCFRWPAVDMDGDGVFDRIDRCVSTPAGCTVDEYGCHADADYDRVCDGVDRCPNTPEGEEVDEHGCADSQRRSTRSVSTPPPPPPAPAPTPPPAPAPPPMGERERQFVETGRLRLDEVRFESGSARLLPESEEALRQTGRGLEKYPNLEVEIEGHTDTSGPAANNLRLSQERADAVRSFLLKNFDLNASNLSAKGYGETRPEVEERSDADKRRNRRVELRVLNPEALPKGVKVDQPR